MTEEILKEIRYALFDKRAALRSEIKTAVETSEILVKVGSPCDYFVKRTEEVEKEMENVERAIDWAYGVKIERAL